MLATVVAHIGRLRAQLQQPPAIHVPRNAAAMGTTGDGDDATNTATPPMPLEHPRGVYPAARADGNSSSDGNSDGLTEVEDMRLNRLLRSTINHSPSKSSSSRSSPSPGKMRRDCPGTATDSGYSNHHHRSGGGGEKGNAASTAARGGLRPRQHDGVAEQMLGAGDSVAIKQPSLAPFEEEHGDFGRDAMISAAPNSGLRSSTAATVTSGGGVRSEVGRNGGGGRGQEEDDLADISDGGFHSGCWKRKYARGEMR